MATKKEILISIDPDGNVTLKVEGVSGPECIDFTKFLEDELGDVTERLKTSEYYESAANVEESIETSGRGE